MQGGRGASISAAGGSHTLAPFCQFHDATLLTFARSQLDALEAAVGEASAVVDQRLLHLLTSRFHLSRHCDAIRRYLLLGQVSVGGGAWWHGVVLMPEGARGLAGLY